MFDAGDKSANFLSVKRRLTHNGTDVELIFYRPERDRRSAIVSAMNPVVAHGSTIAYVLTIPDGPRTRMGTTLSNDRGAKDGSRPAFVRPA